MYNNKTISIVIPCHNEENGIRELLKEKPFFADEIIVVNNWSTDNTKYVAQWYGANVIYEKIIGYGQACRAGLSKAAGDIVIILDGDNSYPLHEAGKLLSFMEQGYCDFAVGCRYPLIHKNSQPIINKIANTFITRLINILFGISLTDSQSGMMAFNRKALNRIKAQNTDMGFSQEFKIKAFVDPEINCGEVHITYSKRIGNVKFKKIEGIKKSTRRSRPLSRYVNKRPCVSRAGRYACFPHEAPSIWRKILHRGR